MRLHGVVAEFMGTGAIAFAPGLLGSSCSSKKKKKDRKSENKDTTINRLENSMSTRRTINEWLPPFKANGYNPGEHTMPTPSGKGVADRTPTQYKVGAYDTDLSGAGKEWPRDHNDTEAMDGVDDENISNSASGAHESTHGEPDDGHQKKVGHDWPKQPKNSGQGVAEPFGGDRWSDGGTLPQGHGPGADTWTGTDGSGMPSDGPITGTDGAQLGHVNENAWNPNNMARLMGEEFDIQGLFNNYARTASAVCVEDFQNLLDAHGADVVIDESSLLGLMNDNAEFMFYEGQDANGPYWVAEALTEGENRRPFEGKKHSGKRPISEMQIRSPEKEANLFTMNGPGVADPDSDVGIDPSAYGGDPDFGTWMGGAGNKSLYDEKLTDGMSNVSTNLECPGCGYQGEDAECPECGVEMMDPMAGEESLIASGGDPIDNVIGRKEEQLASDDGFDPPVDDRGMWESRQRITGPGIVECLKNFMESARNMIERNPKARTRDLAEALNHSWSYHAGEVDARTCPTKVQQTLQGLMRKFPGFNPLVENEAMNRPEGTKLGGGDGPKDNLPKQPTEMTTHGDKSLLGKKQNGKAMAKSGDDAVGGELWLSGTGKGMNSQNVNESAASVTRHTQPTGVATKQVQENIARLATYVKRAIQEGANALGRGKYSVEFSVLVVEGSKPAFLKNKTEKNDKKGKAPPFGKKDKNKKDNGKPDFLKKNRTPSRDNLAEALADAEEILQLHNPADVTFEATFLGPNGQVALKQDIPLFTINPRGPMVGEGKALFRFQRNAEAFADNLVAEGVTCRICPHNWGSAVEAKTSYPIAERAFTTLAESGEGCATLPKKRKKQLA